MGPIQRYRNLYFMGPHPSGGPEKAGCFASFVSNIFVFKLFHCTVCVVSLELNLGRILNLFLNWAQKGLQIALAMGFRTGIRNLAGTDFSLFYSVQTCSGVQSAYFGHRGLLDTGIKR